jgi:hypothetical protein
MWELPERAWVGGVEYRIHGDFRDILRIFRYLDDPELAEPVRWAIALALFYEGQIPQEHQAEAVAFLVEFIRCGQSEAKPGPKLLDWEQDAAVIVADVNRVAGTEVRALPFLHWWTFMAYFNAIGEGQLSTLVSIRDKLARGKKLEKWEQEFYQKNKSRVDLRKRYSAAELAERERLERMLAGDPSAAPQDDSRRSV